MPASQLMLALRMGVKFTNNMVSGLIFSNTKAPGE